MHMGEDKLVIRILSRDILVATHIVREQRQPQFRVLSVFCEYTNSLESHHIAEVSDLFPCCQLFCVRASMCEI